MVLTGCRGMMAVILACLCHHLTLCFIEVLVAHNMVTGFVVNPKGLLSGAWSRCSGRKRVSLWSRCSRWAISCVISFGVYRKGSLLCACPVRLPKTAAQAACCGMLEAPSVCSHAVADRQHHLHTVCYMGRYWKPARNWYCSDSEVV